MGPDTTSARRAVARLARIDRFTSEDADGIVDSLRAIEPAGALVEHQRSQLGGAQAQRVLRVARQDEQLARRADPGKLVDGCHTVIPTQLDMVMMSW